MRWTTSLARVSIRSSATVLVMSWSPFTAGASSSKDGQRYGRIARPCSVVLKFRLPSPPGRREQQDGQAPRALGAVDDHSFDVAGGRRPREEDAVGAGGGVEPPVGVVHGIDGRRTGEQHGQAQRQ